MSKPSKSHIILVGMPCVGKTTVGVLLAKKMGYEFVDLDQMMWDDSGKSVTELLEGLGEEKFLEFEARTLRVAVQSAEPLVIATGGSVVLTQGAREILESQPRVVWLRAPLEAIAQRVENVNRVPLIVGIDDSASPLVDQLEAIYDVRKQHYEKLADIVMDTRSASDPAKIAEQLAEWLSG